jgi:ankyrin repeat protein
VDDVKRFLASDIDVDKDALLNIACGLNKYDVVETLIEAGADVNAVDPIGRTPLYNACMHNEHITQNIFRLLLRNGADLRNCTKEQGSCIIYEICRRGTGAEVKILIDIGVDIRRENYIMMAYYSENYQVVAELIRAGANVNFVDLTVWTPLLHYACVKNHIDIAHLLLKHGADVNMLDTNRQTALMRIARYAEYDQIIVMLLSHGATTKGLTESQLQRIELLVEKARTNRTLVMMMTAQRKRGLNLQYDLLRKLGKFVGIQ